VRHRGMVSSFDHPTAGTVPVVSSPLRFSGSGPAEHRYAPLLGEHTEEVLRALMNLDEQDV